MANNANSAPSDLILFFCELNRTPHLLVLAGFLAQCICRGDDIQVSC